MDLPIVIGVVLFIAIAGSLVALWWWKLADRWADEEHRRFKKKPRHTPREVTIRKDQP